jgi:hypothetical protein
MPELQTVVTKLVEYAELLRISQSATK